MDQHDEQLRKRLARLDPMPSAEPVDPWTSLRAHELMEHAMLTTEHTPNTAAPPRWRLPALAAVAAVIVGIGAVATLLERPGGEPAPQAVTTLALQAAESGASMSCVPFSADVLAAMPVAFGGTVTAVASGVATLDVDRWFKGGTADSVTITTPTAESSTDTPELVQGKRYLVTATNGTVNSCGYSGEATPELAGFFEQAF